MNIIVPIPDDFAARFGSEADLGRRAVEALALEEYRAGRLTDAELRQVLGFATRGELYNFLKYRGMSDAIGLDAFDGQARDSDSHQAADDLVTRFAAFASGRTLGEFNVHDLISEGRR
jgi:hypothetical protein